MAAVLISGKLAKTAATNAGKAVLGSNQFFRQPTFNISTTPGVENVNRGRDLGNMVKEAVMHPIETAKAAGKQLGVLRDDDKAPSKKQVAGQQLQASRLITPDNLEDYGKEVKDKAKEQADGATETMRKIREHKM